MGNMGGATKKSTVYGKILDEKCNLAGVILETVSTYQGNRYLQRTGFALKDLFASNYCNKQIRCVKGVVACVGNFTLKQVENYMINQEQELVKIADEISLLCKLTSNNNVVGYRVLLPTGKEQNLSSLDLVALSAYMSCKGFTVAKMDNGKVYVRGTKGNSVEELPTYELMQNVTNQATKTTAGAIELPSNVASAGKATSFIAEKNCDIMTLFDTLRSFNAVVINFADTEYLNTTTISQVASEDFKSLNIGEICDPKLVLNQTKLNASAPFKKIGSVLISDEYGLKPIVCYTWNTKKLFHNGENVLPRIGVGIPQENVKQFISLFGTGMAVKSITNEKILKPVKQVSGKVDYAYFEVDLSEVSLMTTKNAKEKLMTAEEIAVLLRDNFKHEVTKKLLDASKGLIGEAKKLLTSDPDIEQRELFLAYQNLTPDTCQKLSDIGVNVYDGSFFERENLDTPREKAKTVDSLGKEEREIEITYVFDGLDVKSITSAVLVSGTAEEIEKKLGKSATALVFKYRRNFDNVLNDEDVQSSLEREQLALELLVDYKKQLKEAEQEVYMTNKRLWEHKCAMYILGNKSVHTHDKHVWQEVENKRLKTSKIYKTECSIGTLAVKLVGTEM